MKTLLIITARSPQRRVFDNGQDMAEVEGAASRLPNHLEAGVPVEYPGNDDLSFGRLVVFEQGGNNPGQGKTRSVQCVNDLGFSPDAGETGCSSGVPETLEVADGGDLKPLPLTRGPDLEVVLLRLREAEIPAAHEQHTIGRPSFCSSPSATNANLPVHRTNDPDDKLHQLHLVELVNPIQSPHVLTVRTRLAAKTGRIGAELQGKLIFPEYLIPVEIRHRNFGRWHQIEVIDRHDIHLIFFVRQLSGAGCAGGIDKKRRASSVYPRVAASSRKKLMRARSNRAPFPTYTGKPAPVILVPRAKSTILSFSTSSQCGLSG